MSDKDSARAIFDQFDVNGDGYLTAAEISQVLTQLGGTEFPEDIAQGLIDANDLNGDGLLSFEEFWTARQATNQS